MDIDTVVMPRVAAGRPDGIGRRMLRGLGELLVTLGLVVLLLVVYEVYVTDLISAGKQGEASAALDERWSADANTVQQVGPQRQSRVDLVQGEAFAKMYVPVFGADFRFAIVEGATDRDLEIGPGHYPGTALPGENGNFAVSARRCRRPLPRRARHG
ncbi:hypothetical protein [Saccharothrix sp. Mg75]|uniref:hypothetical protein n=1 Tax=Saccharothrix sp. Mg75 TaxID=3445357 RepID=UPI003EF04069